MPLGPGAGQVWDRPGSSIRSVEEIPIDAKDVAVAVAKLADDMRARDIVALDVSEVLGLTDYFVIATGTSERQLRAVADAIVRSLKSNGVQRLFMSGQNEGGWVLIDFGEVVVHLFSREARAHYRIEGLWEDAGRFDWESESSELALAAPAKEVPFSGISFASPSFASPPGEAARSTEAPDAEAPDAEAPDADAGVAEETPDPAESGHADLRPGDDEPREPGDS